MSRGRLRPAAMPIQPAPAGPTGAVGPTGPASAWGTIPGTLSAQTDLQTALDARELLSHKNAASGYAGLDASSKLTGNQQVYGTAANTAAQGNDSRLSDARTPTAHATSHKSAGFDAIKLDELAAPTDITTLNASASTHGLMPKADANAGHFYSSDGTQKQVPLASGVSGDLPVANLSNGTFTLVDSTATGAQNNWAPGFDGNTLVTWHGAADLPVTGFAGGVVGQIVAIKNTGTKIATFAHNSGSSSAGNKLFNLVTSGLTAIAPGGSIAYQHDGTQWQLIAHEQGDWITPAYDSANFHASGAMTWDVQSGDRAAYAYWLKGRTLFITITVYTSSVGGTPDHWLEVDIPGGYSPAENFSGAFIGEDATAGVAMMYFQVNAGTGFIYLAHNITAIGNWSTSTNTTQIDGLKTWIIVT